MVRKLTIHISSYNILINLNAGPEKIQKLSRLFKYLVTSFIGFSYLGTCSICLVTIAEFMFQLYGQTHSLTIRHCITIAFIPSLSICLIPQLKYLAPISSLSNLINFFAIFATFYYFLEGASLWQSYSVELSFSRVIEFFSSAVFAMNCIGVLASIESQMRKPKDFFGVNGVLNVGMSVVLVTYMFMGVAGSMRFGPEVRDSIILNLPENSTFSYCIKVLLMCSIALSIGLNFFVSFEIFWKAIEPNVAVAKKTKILVAFKLGLILTFYLMAVLVPEIGVFVSLMGAIAYSIVDLVLPPLMQLLVLHNSPNGYGRFNWIIWKNVIMMILGLCIFVFGTASSIGDIYDKYYQPSV